MSCNKCRTDKDEGVPNTTPCPSLGSVKEIDRFRVTARGKHLGSGTYGSHGGLVMVVKQLTVKKLDTAEMSKDDA